MEKEHLKIWNSLERLAKNAGTELSKIGLARKFYSNGKPRWPSTSFVVKVLIATGNDWRDFARFMKTSV